MPIKRVPNSQKHPKQPAHAAWAREKKGKKKNMSQQLQARAAAAARLRKDLASKDNPAFVGCLEKPLQGARILCMTTSDIPCKHAGFGEKKQISAVVVVVNCIMEGWQKVGV